MSQYQPPRRERRSTMLESNAQDRVELSQEHADAVRTTEEHACARETVRGHNRRLQTMIKWFMENYEEECRDIVRDLTSREKEDKDRFWKSTHDLVYEKLDPLVVKAFISGNKVREERSDGTKLFYSYDHLRKYKDAILFGAKRARRSLPPNYDPEMEPFMQSLKKENQSKRKLGQVTEKEADPISFPLYRHICQTALTEGDIFVWCFTIMQWNCIARSINIGNLRFNCLSVGQDSCVVKYWDTKKDKTGEKTCPKNCYANPKDPSICFFTSLACYLAINNETYTGKDTIFLASDTKETSAAQKYCRKLSMFLKKMTLTVKEFIRPDHANAHGIRKGSATRATSGTTCPPPPASVAHRGEWSLGKVFDIYWLFAECGDQYLGRILAGLDPNSLEFAVLPPHFVQGMDNNFIFIAMNMTFKNILELDESGQLGTNLTGILLRCLASIVYHQDYLRKITRTIPGHPLNQLSILNDENLLQNLSSLITTEPSTKIPSPTGIPPHVNILQQVKRMTDVLQELREESASLETKLQQAVENQIERHAIQNGNITYSSLKDLLNEQKQQYTSDLHDYTTNVNTKINELINAVQNNRTINEIHTSETSATSIVNREMFCYDGRFFQVPKNFSFPNSTKRKRAWELWLLGQPGFQLEDGTPAPIPPFRKLVPTLLPQKLRSKFKAEWRPILQKMNSATAMPSLDQAIMTPSLCEATYAIGTNHLKENVCSFLFNQPTKYKRIEAWSVSTWSRYVSYQFIQENGTESDKSNLPPPTHLNSKRKRLERTTQPPSSTMQS